jgi:hypothetical protein
MDRFYSDTNFYNAVKNGNIEEIQSMFNTAKGRNFGKIDINWRHKDDYNNTPLIVAAENNNDDLAMFLLTNGANPNLFNRNGMTPLLYALQNKNYELAQILIDNGANPNFLSNYIEYGTKVILTPLIWALTLDVTDEDKLEIVKFLLTNSADPNIGYNVRDSRIIDIRKINPDEPGITPELRYDREQYLRFNKNLFVVPVTIVKNFSNNGIEGEIKKLILQSKLKKISAAVESIDSLVGEGLNPLTSDNQNLADLSEYMGKGGRKRKRKTNKKRKTGRRKKTGKKRR